MHRHLLSLYRYNRLYLVVIATLALTSVLLYKGAYLVPFRPSNNIPARTSKSPMDAIRQHIEFSAGVVFPLPEFPYPARPYPNISAEAFLRELQTQKLLDTAPVRFNTQYHIHTQVEICNILSKWAKIILIGDSLTRHLTLALYNILNPTSTGGMRTWNMTEQMQ